MKYILLPFLALSSTLAHCQAIDSMFGENYSLVPGLYVPGTTGCDFDVRKDRNYGLLVLEDGRLILPGHSSLPEDGNFAFVTLLPDGKFDETIGPNGEVQLDLGFDNDSCLASSLYGGDKILMGGCVTPSGQSGYAALLVCTSSDGLLDTAFGNQGYIVLDLPGYRDMITEIVPLPDGSIVVAGNMFFGPSYQYPDSTIIFIGKLHPDGQVDTSFGNHGFVYQRFNICPSTLIGDLKLDADNKIILTGGGYHPYPGMYDGEVIWCSHDIHVCRYLPNGQPDGFFGNNGIVALANTWGRGNTLCLYEDGRIMVAGLTNTALTDPIYTFIARMNHDGATDSTFSQDGYFREFINGLLGDGTEPIALALLNDEVLVGFVDGALGANLSFGVLCLTPEGVINQDFGENGIFSYYDYPDLQYWINEMTLSGDGQSLFFSGTYRLIGHTNMLVTKLNISDKNPTEVKTSAQATGIDIYPNPAKDVFRLARINGIGYSKLFIRDMMGKICLASTINPWDESAKINISNLGSGLYTVELMMPGRLDFLKLVIAK